MGDSGMTEELEREDKVGTPGHRSLGGCSLLSSPRIRCECVHVCPFVSWPISSVVAGLGSAPYENICG
jgi:hypothetical protein